MIELGTVATPDFARTAKFPALPSLTIAGPSATAWLSKACSNICQAVFQKAIERRGRTMMPSETRGVFESIASSWVERMSDQEVVDKYLSFLAVYKQLKRTRWPHSSSAAVSLVWSALSGAIVNFYSERHICGAIQGRWQGLSGLTSRRWDYISWMDHGSTLGSSCQAPIRWKKMAMKLAILFISVLCFQSICNRDHFGTMTPGKRCL